MRVKNSFFGKVAALDSTILNRVGILCGALIVCAIFATSIYPIHIYGVIHYNPLTCPTDLLANLFFSVFILSATHSMIGALACLMTVYFVGGVKFYLLRRNLSLSDLDDLNELIDVLPPPWTIVCVISLVFCAYCLYSLSAPTQKPRNSTKWLTSCICATIYVALFPASLFEAIKGKNIDNFNRGADFLKGGQLYSIVYDFVEKKSVKEDLRKKHSNKNVKSRTEFSGAFTPINIHVILLESFSSSERLGVRDYFAKDPLPYKKLDNITYALSPTYGGNSAASEFEILCGTIENHLFGGLTFNSLGRYPSKLCLPNLLRANGYKAIASTGTLAHFFNTGNAYKSIGFDAMYFYDSHPKQDVDGNRISDRELFSENRKNLILQMRKHKGPLFNYLVSIAGHGPYHLNTKSRPLVYNNSDSGIKQYINRVLYTQKELNEHLSSLKKIDPNSIVFIVGDHLVDPAIRFLNLPRFKDTSLEFRKQDYILLRDFVQIDAGTFAYHEFSQVLSNLLSKQAWKNELPSKFIATNIGNFRRSDLAPAPMDTASSQEFYAAIINEKKYHSELLFEIVKNSISDH